MLTIIRAAQEIEDPALILYGAAYRDKTVTTKNRCVNRPGMQVEGNWKQPNEEQVGGSKLSKLAKSEVCFVFNQGQCTY